MTPDSLVREFIAALERKDLDTACTMVTDDCEYDNVPMGKVFGPDGVRSTLGPFLGACGGVDWVIHHQVSDGDLRSGVVLNERLDRFELAGRWVELPVAGVFVVRDGKIALWRDYFDQATFTSLLAGPA
jgi:limonene-1,2-epoxide hydrolase